MQDHPYIPRSAAWLGAALLGTVLSLGACSKTTDDDTMTPVETAPPATDTVPPPADPNAMPPASDPNAPPPPSDPASIPPPMESQTPPPATDQTPPPPASSGTPLAN